MNRKLYTAQAYTNAKQNSYQSVYSFVVYLNNLKNEFPPFLEVYQIDTLFIRFRPKIYTDIANYQDISIIKEDLIALTTRIENNKNNANFKRLYSQRISVDTTAITIRDNYIKAIRILNT